MTDLGYRGRIAPTPSGYLHLGHARTFWKAAERARLAGGTLIFRNEDLDRDRCRPEFAAAAIEDLRWLGLQWQEGPNVGGPFGPYDQSHRLESYHTVWKQLQAAGVIYPSPHSRKDVEEALLAPRTSDEPIFPSSLRPLAGEGQSLENPGNVNWRFRVPDGREITVLDERLGLVSKTAGKDFGDFLVWRKDGYPSYELAVVADDHAMRISEVVRGEDLLNSAARQFLLYESLGWRVPKWYHCPLVCDEQGNKLSKRNGAESLREIRLQGQTAESLIAQWCKEL
jgi:glutamyl-tRNA synthetase